MLELVDFTWRGLASVQKACFRMANWLAGILSVFIKNPLNLSKTGPILARFEVEHDFLKTNIPMINFEVFFFLQNDISFYFLLWFVEHDFLKFIAKKPPLKIRTFSIIF